MEPTGRPILIYRAIVLTLATGFAIYHIATGDYSNFGGPLRKLTYWGLFLSVFVAFLMLKVSLGRSRKDHQIPVMCAAAVNAIVVLLYWQLYFIDPALVHDSADPGAWWDNYYVHLFGPCLQIFDALFIARAFRRIRRAALPLLGIVATYLAMGELILQPLSDYPQGVVTSGLPYPFLNDMELLQRAVFYAQNAGVAMAFLIGFGIIGWIFGRLSRR